MINSKNVYIEISDKTYNKVKEILEKEGMSISEGIEFFLLQTIINKKIPFEIDLSAPENLIVKDRADLIKKLQIAENDISSGDVFPLPDAIKHIRENPSNKMSD